ncbi:hypothetical protein ABIC94_004425 [Variovorax paradoxus]
MTQALSSKIVEIAHARRRFGYRRIHDMLRPHFPGVNHKRICRLYSAANLAVRKRKKVRRPANERVPLQLATTVNEVWSMDFVSDSLSTGRRITPAGSGAGARNVRPQLGPSPENFHRSGSARLAGGSRCSVKVGRLPAVSRRMWRPLTPYLFRGSTSPRKLHPHCEYRPSLNPLRSTSEQSEVAVRITRATHFQEGPATAAWSDLQVQPRHSANGVHAWLAQAPDSQGAQLYGPTSHKNLAPTTHTKGARISSGPLFSCLGIFPTPPLPFFASTLRHLPPCSPLQARKKVA